MLLRWRWWSQAWITGGVFLRRCGCRSVTGRNICRCLGCRGVNRGSDLGHQTWIVYYDPIVTFLISWGILYLLRTAQSWDLPSGCDLFFLLSHCSSSWTEIIFLCKFKREAFLNLHTFLILKKGQNPLCPPIIMILSNNNSTLWSSQHSCQISIAGGLNQDTALEPPHQLWAVKGSLNMDPDTILSEHQEANV